MRALALFAVLLLGPIGVLAFGNVELDAHWSTASRESSRQAPDPAADPEPVIQVYGARAFKWRGAFGIHTWIAAKRRGADSYTVYQVLGWNVYRGRPSVAIHRGGAPDSR